MSKILKKEVLRLLGLREEKPRAKQIESAPHLPKPYPWRPYRRSDGNLIRNHPEAREYSVLGVYGWQNQSDQVDSTERKFVITYEKDKPIAIPVNAKTKTTTGSR